MRSLLITGLLAATALRASAQFRLDGGVTTSSMDARWAYDRGVSTGGWGTQLDLSAGVKKYFILSGEVGALFHEDARPFSAGTPCTMGCPASAGPTSHISMFLASGAVGVQRGSRKLGPFELNPSVRFGATAYMSRRRLSNCDSCEVQDLALPLGVFLEPRVSATAVVRSGGEFGRPFSLGMTVGYRRYVSGLFTNSVLLRLGGQIGAKKEGPGT